jgi:hypothetical protein
LIATGEHLYIAIEAECFPEKLRALKQKDKNSLKTLPSFIGCSTRVSRRSPRLGGEPFTPQNILLPG